MESLQMSCSIKNANAAKFVYYTHKTLLPQIILSGMHSQNILADLINAQVGRKEAYL